MSNSRNRDSIGNDNIDDVDRIDHSSCEEIEDSSAIDEASSTGFRVSGVGTSSTTEIGLGERLRDILVNGDDGDLLLQRSERESGVLQWLQALDLQVMGACRADERLKPLLKMNTSSVMTEDHLLTQLSQHFEPAEVGMLARCFCIPLVSVRVGKIDKQGTLLCPTPVRGNLNLMVLPTSDFRLTFVGDDGQVERLLTLSGRVQCAALEVNDIPADSSGRSFVIKNRHGQVCYFWCCEKSKLLGRELLSKVKDLLKRKPSIAELTGISEARLGCFANHLRVYLVGSALGSSRASSLWLHSSEHPSSEPSDAAHAVQSLSISSKPFRSRHTGTPSVKSSSQHQINLSPRSSSFKEGLPRSLSSLKGSARDKLRRLGDSLAVDNQTIVSSGTSDSISSNQSEPDKVQASSVLSPLSSSSFLESLGKLTDLSSSHPASETPCTVSSLSAPYYCWCSPSVPSFQSSAEPFISPATSVVSSSSPPLVTLPSNLLSPTLPLNLADAPLLDFPALLPDPLVRLSMPSSQQIPTFTPLICDPIVHIPVIDVCSSGQGYLVSAGPTISTTIPPMHTNLVSPLIQEAESMVEKDARETLRLLINGSSQTSPPLVDVLPNLLGNAERNQSMLVAGSRGLYSGTEDANVIANSIAAIGLVSLSGQSAIESFIRTHNSRADGTAQPEKSPGSESCSSVDADSSGTGAGENGSDG